MSTIRMLSKAIKIMDSSMWEGTFKIINSSLNEVERIINEAVSKKDDKKAQSAFRKLKNIESTLEAYRNETSTAPADKRELYKLRERKKQLYEKLVNSKIL